ncbi:MAG: amidohydrolase [Rhodospirillales bacterium]|jgi:guanine deaminase|nr:amidohydrolase [Rhodospirillales bacterium]MDP7651400.1 amidohydrolase [Rhodospirillales bacterium]
MAPAPFTVIRGGRLLDGDAADILIEGDAIKEIGLPGLAAPEGADVIDAADMMLIPGLVNAHTHGDASLAKGLGDRLTLELLLNATPLTSERFRLEDKYLAAKLAAVEMVLSGCTACYDLFSEFPAPSPEGLAAVGRGYADVGMRAVVAPLMADRSFWQAIPGLIGSLPDALKKEVERVTAEPAEASIAACRQALKDWSFDRDRVRLALAPTIPHHCEDTFFRACRELADEFGVGIHSHVAESKVQAVVGMRKFGKTLTAHLDDLGIVGPDFTAAHAVWVDDDDIRRLADRGATVAHNPTSNLRLGVGIAKVRSMIDGGLNVGIGTDASTCSDGLNMFEAMRLANTVSRIHSPDPSDWLTAENVIDMATRGSARGLGFDGSIGALEPGFKADIVFLDLGRIQYLPLNHAARQMVFQENGSGVKHVMIDGRLIVRNRRVLTVDYAKLRDEVMRANDRLRLENEDAARLVRQLEPLVGQFCVGLAKEPYHVNRYVGA